jgi:hypothetical protein
MKLSIFPSNNFDAKGSSEIQKYNGNLDTKYEAPHNHKSFSVAFKYYGCLLRFNSLSNKLSLLTENTKD